VPIDAAPADLVADVERSEFENVVVKRNAGRPNENVKHPWPLLRRLNLLVAPGFADALMSTHANSSLGPASESRAAESDAALGPADAAGAHTR
jgi:hypothetical protein